MGLEGEHIDAAINMIDEIGIQGVLERQSIGVRFATTPQAKRSPNIWRAKAACWGTCLLYTSDAADE